MIQQFVAFIREQGVIGLAVGFILGGAVAKVVSSLVEDLVNPLLGLALGSAEGLKEATFAVGEATIRYGSFLSTVLDFLVIAAVIFMMIRVMGLDKLDKKK
jgi:large conductance mechanosensitive channel